MNIDQSNLQEKLRAELSLQGQNYSVGVDCEDVERWRQLLPSLAKQPDYRLFTESEHECCLSTAEPAESYAGRWCAKEAVFKALSSRYQIDLRQIEILADRQGRPIVMLPPSHPAALTAQVRVSITHTQSMAIAFALALFNDV